ncbi:MAG: type 1 glutamine amidotransferase [Rhodobacteraceae bacterium]|nr:type 1 glutamine amidotransferase [Paracoccaceae bacterium]
MTGKIAIVDLSSKPSPLLDSVPGFGVMVKRWLSQTIDGDDLVVIDVAHAGQPVPAATDYEGFVIGGSEKGVYDETVWMEPVRGLLHAARLLGKPVFGICFGHQIMAEVYGGKAEQVDLGEMVGPREFVINATEQTAYVWHHDQVTDVPPLATVIGSAPYCPIAALAYEFPAMSVQFHPEYTGEFFSNVLDLGRGNFLDNETTSTALERIKSINVDTMIMANEAAAFFQKHTS